MDYKNQHCPSCGEQFTNSEDIVVCPLCGTPQHRDCYNTLGHCVNEDKHGDDFSWKAEHAEEETEYTDKDTPNANKCPACSALNSGDSLFCKKCGTPLISETPNTERPHQQGQGFGQMPFGFSPFAQNATVIDKNTDMGEGVTANELAKFVKTNVPYYITIFHRIKTYGASRFSFAAFLFSGGWFLYRKQYLKGAIIALVVALTLIVPSFFIHESRAVVNSISANITGTVTNQAILNEVFKLPIEKQFYFVLPYLAEALRFIVMLVCGLTANRTYRKYCIKTINGIKARQPYREQTIEESGGTNKPLAVCMLICYIIVLFLPQFL